MEQINTSTNQKGAYYYILQFVRILVGVLFIFSGLIKANDPLGLAYKMEEFFELWHMQWLSPYALGLSITIIAFEIVAGAALLLGYAFRQFAFLLLLLMVFFTFLTGYAVWYEYEYSRELKCGCFGDCIPLTAHQSFWKDIILLVLVVLLLIGRKHIKPLFPKATNTILLLLSLVFSVGIQWYVLKHLPIVDCLPYKVGNNIWEKMQAPPGSVPDVIEFTYTMKNLKTAETKEMSLQEYTDTEIWKDSLTWKIEGEPKEKLIKKGNNTPLIKDFNVSDYDGEDYTETLLTEPGYNFLFLLKDVNTAATDNINKLKQLFAQCEKGNVGYYLISASPKAEVEAFMKKYDLNMYYFSIDGTVCKTMMRSNPGLILIKAGTVKGKWSNADFPSKFEMNADNMRVLP